MGMSWKEIQEEINAWITDKAVNKALKELEEILNEVEV